MKISEAEELNRSCHVTFMALQVSVKMLIQTTELLLPEASMREEAVNKCQDGSQNGFQASTAVADITF